MVAIKIKKGLDIPMDGQPKGPIRPLVSSGESRVKLPHRIALNLEPFTCRFHLLAKVGDKVRSGDPIAEDKNCPGRFFVAPISGLITEIVRGEKRVVQNVVIECDEKLGDKSFSPTDPSKTDRSQLTALLMEGGVFSKIRQRPFNILANPAHPPRSIFVKAIESAPCVPPAELQVEGHERDFQTGLNALVKLTDGPVHLVYREGSICKAFTEAQNVVLHTASGPHPISNPSLHIQEIDPIRKAEDVIWTLNAHDVVSIGHLLNQGKIYKERVIGIGGSGVLFDRVGFYRVFEGTPVEELISGRVDAGTMRFISGDPLNGHQVHASDYLRFNDFAFTVIPEMTRREFLHFFRLGGAKYSFSRAYLSGHLDSKNRTYSFTTSLHGEHRPFIDSTLYDKVQPLSISTMLLVKAVMAEDYDLAERLGILEVVPEDFSLPDFVDPSKVGMTEIIRNGQQVCIQNLLHG